MLRVPADFGEQVRRIYALDHPGIMDLPDVVDPGYLQELSQEASEAQYRVSKAGILSNVGICRAEPDLHPRAMAFRDGYDREVRRHLGDLFGNQEFDNQEGHWIFTSFNLNGVTYLRYPEGVGCAKHRNGPHYKYMTSFFLLEGEGGVWVDGTEYGTGPGSLTIMRAPRFENETRQEDWQPLHWVKPATRERVVLRMSQLTF